MSDVAELFASYQFLMVFFLENMFPFFLNDYHYHIHNLSPILDECHQKCSLVVRLLLTFEGGTNPPQSPFSAMPILKLCTQTTIILQLLLLSWICIPLPLLVFRMQCFFVVVCVWGWGCNAKVSLKPTFYFFPHFSMGKIVFHALFCHFYRCSHAHFFTPNFLLFCAC